MMHTSALHAAIHAQQATPWGGRAPFDAAIEVIYRLYESDALARVASAHSAGGA